MNSMTDAKQHPTHKIAVVIPCYRVRNHIIKVLSSIGKEVSHIYVVDDCCPDNSGELVESQCFDPRVKVLRNTVNQGVGGAVIRGYWQAIEDNIDVIVKVDGDGQMDPRLIKRFVAPILSGQADYTKGNRFYDLSNIDKMPRNRVFGNAALSILAKLSTGYWDIFDPTNGYTAIHAKIAKHLPLEKISKRYFFETDILFRLNTFRAAVIDIPMDAVYGDEVSNLKISKIFGEFLIKHIRNFGKRIFYNYFLRNLTIASIELMVGALLICFGGVYGLNHWIASSREGIATPAGTVMLAAMPILLGLQLILSFFSYDVAQVPSRAIHPSLIDLEDIVLR